MVSVKVTQVIWSHIITRVNSSNVEWLHMLSGWVLSLGKVTMLLYVTDESSYDEYLFNTNFITQELMNNTKVNN